MGQANIIKYGAAWFMRTPSVRLMGQANIIKYGAAWFMRTRSVRLMGQANIIKCNLVNITRPYFLKVC